MRPWLAVIPLAFLVGCPREIRPPSTSTPTREEIWEALQPRAVRYRIEPTFIYALIAAESGFDPRARNGSARGLMQLTPMAWRSVSNEPYEPAVWDWRKNLEAGIDYLAHTRSHLQRKNAFSYPVLLAAFHHGMDYVEDRKFDASRCRIPGNDIYRELWRGNLAPVPPP